MNRLNLCERHASPKAGRVPSILLPVMLAMLALTACDRRDPPAEPVPSSPPPNTAAPTPQGPSSAPAVPGSSPSTSGGMTDPSKGPGTEMMEKGGTESGMVGGASGTAESSASKEQKEK